MVKIFIVDIDQNKELATYWETHNKMYGLLHWSVLGVFTYKY
jgi:hypothetical protein